MPSRALIILLTVGSVRVEAQPPQRAESLIAETARLARDATSWNAEGYVVRVGADGGERTEQFRIASQQSKPIRAHLEIKTGTNQLLRVCDGESQWTYYPKMNGYVRVYLPQIGPCAYPTNAWPPLVVTLQAPILGALDQPTVDGHPRRCQVVRGTFSAFTNDASRRDLELCVDPVTKTILRYKMQELSPHPHVEAFTFTSIERNPKLDADLFEFHPPEGSKEIAKINWLEPGLQSRQSVFRVSNEVSAPILVRVIAPASGPSRQHGAVVVSAEISADGVPLNLKVVQVFGQGLDETAIEAIKQWRFDPALKDGNPVAVATAIAVNVP